MQEKIQHQAMEDFYGLLQLLANCCYHRRENLHNAWWSQSRPELNGADPPSHAPNRRKHFHSRLHEVAASAWQDQWLVSTDSNGNRFPIAVCSVTCYGLTLTRTSLDGARMTEVSPSPSALMLCLDSCRSMTWTSSAEHIKSSRTDTSSSRNDSWSPCSARPITVESSTMPEP